ncbi:MAG TPA: lipoprotein [Gammaproteobacteria bacterium]|jgi:predicted small lipoprotein YifL
MKRGSVKRYLRSSLAALRSPLLAALLLAATGCGQTGPLTLPEPAAPMSTSGTPPADAAADEDDQSDSDER